MAFIFKEWYDNISEHDILLAYNGQISSGIVDETLDNIEEILISKGLKKKKVRRAYNAIVEGVQKCY